MLDRAEIEAVSRELGTGTGNRSALPRILRKIIEGGGIAWSPSGLGSAKTVQDVMTTAARLGVPPTVFCFPGETYSFPARATPYDFKQGGFHFPLGANVEIRIEDGATLLDVEVAEGSGRFIGLPTDDTKPSFDYSAFYPPLLGTGTPGVFLSRFAGGIWINNGTAPMLNVPDNAFVVFAGDNGGGVESTLVPNQETIRLGELSILLFTAIGRSLVMTPNGITGPASSTIVVQHDGCQLYPPPGALPNFLGVLVNAPMSIDGGAGPASFRPAGTMFFGPVQDGCRYLDTGSHIPQWHDAVANVWRDAQGVIVP